MFYEDEDVQVVQLGKGDVLVAGGILRDFSAGTVSFIENCGISKPIGSAWNKCKDAGIVEDTDLNTVVRLVFTNKDSIDIVIAELERAKKYMEDPKAHPDYDEIKSHNKRVEQTETAAHT